MIDHQELKICLREELGKLGVAETEEDRLVTELNVLASLNRHHPSRENLSSRKPTGIHRSTNEIQ
jgi:hypothetical protein